MAVSGDPFSESNAANLAAELSEQIESAEMEWKKIDLDLAKWFGLETAALVAVTGTSLPQLAASTAIAGSTNVAVSLYKHYKLSRTPAGFFLRNLGTRSKSP